jgi:glycosyltransferase involved in cell wall biosynthesis
MTKVCILTSVHPLFDTRIFHKEAKSLARAGYDVTLIAQHDKYEVLDGIRIVPLSKPKNRIERMTREVRVAYRKALETDANIYHFHDPELIPLGLLLKIRGKKVIYDVHEDVPRQILSKYWIPLKLRSLISKAYNFAEKVAAWALNGIVAATPTIADRFQVHKTETVQNFPIMGELVKPKPVPYNKRPLDLAYIGGISDIRGAREMVQSIELLPKDLDIRLILAGKFSPLILEQELRLLPGWSRVKFLGWQSRLQIVNLLSSVCAGLVLLHPTPNYIDSQPVKLFEYMCAGIPVIASNFPLWREIIEGAGCGICIDPLNPEEIAGAIQFIIEHPAEAEQMGKNGRGAVEEKYNWGKEEKNLLKFYSRIALTKAPLYHLPELWDKQRHQDNKTI